MTDQTRNRAGDAIRTVLDTVARDRREGMRRLLRANYAPDYVLYLAGAPAASIVTERALVEWFDTWRGPIGIARRELSITAERDLAICTSLNQMTGTKTDGVKVHLWYRATVGLRRIDGRWKIVHEHESVPFYMDGSFRAAVDLAP
jgi:PhnB protein